MLEITNIWYSILNMRGGNMKSLIFYFVLIGLTPFALAEDSNPDLVNNAFLNTNAGVSNQKQRVEPTFPGMSDIARDPELNGLHSGQKNRGRQVSSDVQERVAEKHKNSSLRRPASDTQDTNASEGSNNNSERLGSSKSKASGKSRVSQ